MTRDKLSVAIIGGGIGGLSAALSLLRLGIDAHVYEQARQPREVGAGIQLGANACCVLHRLGLAQDLARMGVRPLAIHQRRWDDGRTLLRSPLGDALEAEFGFPHYQSHRADVLAALINALPRERLHAGHRLIGAVDRGERVEAEFENGTRVSADVLVGADGIHSAVRRIVFGPDKPRFTGVVAYRGLIPAERLAHLELPVEQQLWMGPGSHFVHYYVQNRRLVNFVANIDRDSWTRESWTDRGEVSDLLAIFEGWHPQIREIISNIDETFVWALFERPAMTNWSVGRITLLGDACHAMLPYMAQGAAQAIEDGATLAACLAKFGRDDVPGGLHRYEELRIPRATRVQELAGRNKARFHLPDGPEQEARDHEMATGATDYTFRAISWIYGHDAAAIEV